MLWSLMPLFGKFVTPRQLPSHLTSGKNTKRVKIRRCSIYLKARSAISKAHRLEYDWLWDGQLSETISLVRVHNSSSFGVWALPIQRWSHVRACRFQAATRLHSHTNVRVRWSSEGYALKTFNFEHQIVEAHLLATSERNVNPSERIHKVSDSAVVHMAPSRLLCLP